MLCMYFRMYEEYVGNASNTSKTTKTTNTTNTSKTSKTSPHHHYSYITVQYNTRFTSTTEHSHSHPPHADLANTTAAQPPYHLTIQSIQYCSRSDLSRTQLTHLPSLRVALSEISPPIPIYTLYLYSISYKPL